MLSATTSLYKIQFTVMPLPYSVDLRWRIVWLSITGVSTDDIAIAFTVSFCIVYRYVKLFCDYGDVVPAARRNGPKHL